MLLFIVDGSVSSWYYCRFNTSHVTLYLIFDSQKIVLAEFQYITCYSLSESLMISSVSADVSIHHMLLFIFRLTENVSLVKFVSIHHILLFIGATSAAAVTIHAGFNTSHVTLYLRAEIEKIKVPFGFNTSHVTLYLSKNLVLKEYEMCFNTSHVTLYHRSKKKIQMHLQGFNTSHVTLYLYHSSQEMVTINGFNTSHVTLYQIFSKSEHRQTNVSIHHMLLFIWDPDEEDDQKDGFQYITCYSLSWKFANDFSNFF